MGLLKIMEKFKSSSFAGVLPLIFALAACTSTGMNDSLTPSVKPQQTKAVASGELLDALEGGLIGRLQGNGIVRGDRTIALQNEYLALEYTAPGEVVLWQGKTLSGRIVPSQPYRVGSQDCRQYEHTVIDRGAESSVKGTACRNESGSWTLLS